MAVIAQRKTLLQNIGILFRRVAAELVDHGRFLVIPRLDAQCMASRLKKDLLNHTGRKELGGYRNLQGVVGDASLDHHHIELVAEDVHGILCLVSVNSDPGKPSIATGHVLVFARRNGRATIRQHVEVHVVREKLVAQLVKLIGLVLHFLLLGLLVKEASRSNSIL